MLSIITGRRASLHRTVWGWLLIAGITGATGCDRVPLLAPNSSTITLSTNSTVVQANGTAEISATVLEVSGTPVQNGTTVTFSTNLGVVAPRESLTLNGVATTQFVANGQSGVAEVRATSGSAKPSDTANSPLKITVGSAAINKIVVTANPNRLGAGGGTSTITAVVTDTNGNTLLGIPVSFSTSAGSLSSAVATTSSSGQASTTLTTTKDATVTASAGTTAPGTTLVTVGTLPTLTISVPSGSVTQGQTVTFTVTVTAAATDDAFTSVILNFGDGNSSPPLGGSTSVQHVYNSSGAFTPTVTGTTATGDLKSASTSIVVQSIVVTLAVSKGPARLATFSASISPSTVTGVSYFWDFGDGNSQVTTPPATHTYATDGPWTARVFVTTANGQNASLPVTFTFP